jgi:hypothetical protein
MTLSREVTTPSTTDGEGTRKGETRGTERSAGLEHLLRYSLFDAIAHRRSRRISRGIRDVWAGSLSYHSHEKAEPLTPLEEAILIAATGITGITMPDMPFKTESGENLVGSPMMELVGRAASSPDNCQGTHFFLINDSGTYLLQRPKDIDPGMLQGPITAEKLIALAAKCKRMVLAERLDFPREYPCYFGRNKYVSNVPGSTILLPIVDLTRQYINGMMYLLSEPDGFRPSFIDDWNFYRPAGVSKWIKNGFLNKDLPIPLGSTGTFRIHVEADLLVQNLLLMIQAMGLGGWVHAGFFSQLLLGHPDYRDKYGPGLAFRYERPRNFIRRTLLRPFTPLPAWQPNPVGLDGLIECYTPPYYKDMSAAVDALLASKYGPNGVYRNLPLFDEVFKPGRGAQFLEEVPHYSDEVVACVKDVCNYIYSTYGRFPAHVDAIFVPGVWVQAHHLDLAYYDNLYKGGYSSTQADHERLWHSSGK